MRTQRGRLDARWVAARGGWWHPQPSDYVTLTARLLTLAMAGAIGAVAAAGGIPSDGINGWWLLLAVSAVCFSSLQVATNQPLSGWIPVIEAACSFVIVANAPPTSWPLLIYVIMAPVFVGIGGSAARAIWTTVTQVFLFLILTVLDLTIWAEIPTASLLQAALIGLGFGIAAATVRRLAERASRRAGGYVLALSLLEQLSEVSRQLPAGLDLDSVASQVRQNLIDALNAEDVAVYVQGPNGNWMLRAGDPRSMALVAAEDFAPRRRGFGPTRLSLSTLPEVPHDAANPWTDSTHTRLLHLDQGRAASAVAVARFERRVVLGVVSPQLQETADDAAAQLAAAQVYTEVRERATSEERRRVSREIHDGVAQDLAALAYQLDNTAMESGLAPVEEAAQEVRRLVRELRLSIFDLRTGLTANEALGVAIGDYAQQIASSTGIVVHTTVSEQGPELDPHMAHELLRICQESVTNSRRHSGAKNLWITYRNSAHGWLLRVADDGVGTVQQTSSRGLHGEGLLIMSERVDRIGAALSIRRRIGGGTVVEVSHGWGRQRTPRDPIQAKDLPETGMDWRDLGITSVEDTSGLGDGDAHA